MRRRRGQEQAGGNLDSLLDTMTNVVGILVIVLIMTQVNVADAVRRLRDGLPSISEQQLAQLREDAVKVDEEIELLRAPEQAVDPEKLKDAQVQVGLLKVELEKEKASSKPKESLLQLIAERTKKLAKAKADKKAAEDKLGGLRTEIETLQALAERPPARVRMPDPRPAREDAKRALFACIGDRVYAIDEDGLAAKAKAAIEKGGRALIHSEEMAGKKKVITYKREESTKHIGKGKVGDSTATVELRTYPDRVWANIYITPRPDGGEPISKVRSSDRGAVRQRMQKAFLARDYIYFMVAPDAFTTYLEARRIAEVDHNSPVGWEFTNQDMRIYKGLSGVRFEHTPPPPPKPDPKPKPKPKPPGKPNVLD